MIGNLVPFVPGMRRGERGEGEGKVKVKDTSHQQAIDEAERSQVETDQGNDSSSL